MLWADRTFWVAVGLFVLAVAPYALPLLSDEGFYDWRYVYVDIPLSAAALLAVLVGARSVGSAAERHLWRLAAVAYLAVAVVEAANAFLPVEAHTPFVRLLLNSGFMVYYAALMLAAGASRGVAANEGLWNLHRLRSLGLSVLGVSFLLYFQVLPYDPVTDSAGPWHAGLFLFGALDVVLVLMFLHARACHEDRRWRGILAGMAAISAVYAVVDLGEAVLNLQPIRSVDPAPIWDFAWFVPPFLSVLVARRFLADVPAEFADPVVYDPPRLDRGFLVFGLFLGPALHVGLYYLGILAPELRTIREGVVAIFVLTMGAVTLWYFRLLERERARSESELALSEERYRSFVRARSDGIYRAEVDPPLSIDLESDAVVEAIAERLRIDEASDVVHLPAGVPAPTVGDPFVELFPTGSLWREGLRRWVESGYRIDLEVVHQDQDGQRWYYRYGLTGIVVDEKLRRVWLTRSDITPKRRADEQAEGLKRELEQSRRLESLGTLTGGLAQDFNNLLAPIMGYTHLAREAIDRNDPAAADSLEHVLNASQRAADLVEQVMMVSRDGPRRRVPMRLQDTIRGAARLIRTGLPSTIAVDTTLDDDCPPVLGDANRLHQVVLNLCTNAAQAIGPLSGRIEVRLSHEPPEAPDAAEEGSRGWVVIEVEDDGPGLSRALQARVFEPFFTTKATGESPGLGLSVVHGIVAGHDGTLDFDSEPGVGTCVTVRLPATAPARLGGGRRPGSGRRRLRVLVVDHDSAVAGVTRSSLEAYGHEVTEIVDPYMALKELRSDPSRYDVVVTDDTMPGLTGLDMVDAVKDVAPGAGVVLSSGYILDDHKLTTGVVHLSKPFTPAQLADTVVRAKALVGAGKE